MTTIISPIVITLETIVLVTILVIVLLRLYSGRLSETSILLRLTLLFLLALDTGASTYLVTFYFVNLPNLMMSVLGVLLLAFGVSLCIGFLAPIGKTKAQDDVWTRWFKERDSWEEERRKSALVEKE